MSIYHYLACIPCKEYCDGSTSSTSQNNRLIDSEFTLSPFIDWHAGCKEIKIIHEDDRYLDTPGIVRWTRDNIETLRTRNFPA